MAEKDRVSPRAFKLEDTDLSQNVMLFSEASPVGENNPSSADMGKWTPDFLHRALSHVSTRSG